MSDQDISINRDFRIIVFLSLRDTIFNKHRNSIKFNAMQFQSGIAQVVDVASKAIYTRLMQTTVMIARDENFIKIIKTGKPLQKVYGFLKTYCHSEIS